MKRWIIGSRGSALAVAQTRWAIGRLQSLNPDCNMVHQTIKTQGDKDQSTPLHGFSGTGVFVKELQNALLRGEIDCAVHSLKDVPEEEPAGLCLAAFPEREDARDVFVGNVASFWELKKGARIGTGSPRRVLQLQQLFPDGKYEPMRGNLDTRLSKVESGEWDGIILAAAGLRRLNLAGKITQVFSVDQLLPAIGQGCLVLECREGDSFSVNTARSINDSVTEACVRVEREFMSLVGGGCKVPMACFAYPSGPALRMAALMGDPKTGKKVRRETQGSFEELSSLVSGLAEEMIASCRDQNIPIPKELPEHYLLDPHDKS